MKLPLNLQLKQPRLVFWMYGLQDRRLYFFLGESSSTNTTNTLKPNKHTTDSEPTCCCLQLMKHLLNPLPLNTAWFFLYILPLKLIGSAGEEGVGSARRRWRIERVQLLLLLGGEGGYLRTKSRAGAEGSATEEDVWSLIKAETDAALWDRTVTPEQIQAEHSFVSTHSLWG